MVVAGSRRNERFRNETIAEVRGMDFVRPVEAVAGGTRGRLPAVLADYPVFVVIEDANAAPD